MDPRIPFLQQILQKYIELLQAFKKRTMEENRKKFYQTTVACLGTDVTPHDEVPDEVACAITINRIHRKAFGFEIGGGASTYLLYRTLLNSKFFTKIDGPEWGAIIISPSGYGNGRLAHGHAGIVGEMDDIMSNDSDDGIFKKNYSIDTWVARYQKVGGYPVEYFRRI